MFCFVTKCQDTHPLGPRRIETPTESHKRVLQLHFDSGPHHQSTSVDPDFLSEDTSKYTSKRSQEVYYNLTSCFKEWYGVPREILLRVSFRRMNGITLTAPLSLPFSRVLPSVTEKYWIITLWSFKDRAKKKNYLLGYTGEVWVHRVNITYVWSSILLTPLVSPMEKCLQLLHSELSDGEPWEVPSQDPKKITSSTIF